MPARREPLAMAGVAATLVFWCTLLGCATRIDGYHHVTNLVSELGAMGSPVRWPFNLGLMLCGVFGFVFVAGSWRACRQRGLHVGPVLAMLVHPVAVIGAAAFPLPDPLHGILGSPAVALPAAPILALVLWSPPKRPGGAVPFALLSLAFLAAGCMVFAPDVVAGRFGLIQRFAHVGWSIWFAYLGLALSGYRLRPRPRRVSGPLG